MVFFFYKTIYAAFIHEEVTCLTTFSEANCRDQSVIIFMFEVFLNLVDSSDPMMLMFGGRCLLSGIIMAVYEVVSVMWMSTTPHL